MEIYSQAGHLDLAVAKYGLFILIINVNAMTRREKGGRRPVKTARVVAVAEHGSKSSFLKWSAYVTGDELVLHSNHQAIHLQGIDNNYCLGKNDHPL